MGPDEGVEESGGFARVDRRAERADAMAVTVTMRAADDDLRVRASREDERCAIDVRTFAEERRGRGVRRAVRDLIDRHHDERAGAERVQDRAGRAARIDGVDAEPRA